MILTLEEYREEVATYFQVVIIRMEVFRELKLPVEKTAANQSQFLWTSRAKLLVRGFNDYIAGMEGDYKKIKLQSKRLATVDKKKITLEELKKIKDKIQKEIDYANDQAQKMISYYNQHGEELKQDPLAVELIGHLEIMATVSMKDFLKIWFR